jgi:hypothetical protein
MDEMAYNEKNWTYNRRAMAHNEKIWTYNIKNGYKWMQQPTIHTHYIPYFDF